MKMSFHIKVFTVRLMISFLGFSKNTIALGDMVYRGIIISCVRH